jgi:hypothetical protein
MITPHAKSAQNMPQQSRRLHHGTGPAGHFGFVVRFDGGSSQQSSNLMHILLLASQQESTIDILATPVFKN